MTRTDERADGSKVQSTGVGTAAVEEVDGGGDEGGGWWLG